MGRPVPPTSEAARVIWESGDLALTTCPVRAITPEARAILRTFHLTHDLSLGLGMARWGLVRLPAPGSIGEQDARLMAELEYVRTQSNAGLLADVKAATDARADRSRRKDRRR